jgi:hypothetical protein
LSGGWRKRGHENLISNFNAILDKKKKMIIITPGIWRLRPGRRWSRIGRPVRLRQRKFPENFRRGSLNTQGNSAEN